MKISTKSNDRYSEGILFIFRVAHNKFCPVEHLVRLTCIHLRGSNKTSVIEAIQDNSLHRNLPLLGKLNKKRKVEEAKIKAFIKKMIPLKSDRNRFIHPVWFQPYEIDGSIQITCLDVTIVEEENKSGTVTRCDSTHFTYDIEDIKYRIDLLDTIYTDQAEIYQRLERG